MKNLLRVVLVLALAAGLTACKKNVKDDANADLTGRACQANFWRIVLTKEGRRNIIPIYIFLNGGKGVYAYRGTEYFISKDRSYDQ